MRKKLLFLLIFMVIFLFDCKGVHAIQENMISDPYQFITDFGSSEITKLDSDIDLTEYNNEYNVVDGETPYYSQKNYYTSVELINGNKTLDLNGHILKVGNKGFLIKAKSNGKNFSIIDSSENKSGKIIVENDSNLSSLFDIRTCDKKQCHSVTINIFGGYYELGNYDMSQLPDDRKYDYHNFIYMDDEEGIQNINVNNVILKHYTENNISSYLMRNAYEFKIQNVVSSSYDVIKDYKRVSKNDIADNIHTSNKSDVYIAKNNDLISFVNFESKNFGYNNIETIPIVFYNDTDELLSINSIVLEDDTYFELCGNPSFSINSHGFNNESIKIKHKIGLKPGKYATNVIVRDGDHNLYVKSIEFLVNKIKKEKPILISDLQFDYDEKEHEISFLNFDGNSMEISGNKATNVGKYLVSIRLKEGYYWTDETNNEITYSWNIRKNIQTVRYEDIGNLEYDGNEKEPDITIQDGNYQLVKDIDFIVSYDNNVEIGTATALVEGIGNYKGTKELTFEIVESKIVSVESSLENIDFGESYINYDKNISKTLILTNTGNVAVKLSITNPVSNGPFISLGFSNNYVLEPNKSYTVTLAAGTGRIFSDTPGIYNGNYIFTAKTLDNEKSFDLSIPAKIVLKKLPMHISYTTHVQTYGWQKYVKDGQMSGTQGKSKRLEGIKIKLENPDYNGNIEYRTHIQKLGWEEKYKKNNEMSGTEGKSYRLEAIQIRLTGKMKEHFDVYYRVHAQKFGWLGWAKNDEMAGTAGYAYRLEGIEIRLVEKGQSFSEYDVSQIAFSDKYAVSEITLNKTNISIEVGEEKVLTATINPDTATDKILTWTSSAPEIATVDQNGKITAISEGTTTITVASKNGKKATVGVNVLSPIPGVSYTTHVQTYGWQKYVSNGTMAGTQGEAKRLEAIKIKLKNIPYSGNIEYRTHIQKLGWEGSYKKNDEISGTSGLAYRLEAIQIRLTGGVEEHYDIYYRVHAQKFGWLGWAKNNEMSGTAGYAYRLEGIEIQLVEKGQSITENENQTDKSPFYEKPSVSKENALRKANEYLNVMAFSYDGLIEQLEFEKFSHGDAVWAADNVGVNWNEQAVKKAQSYLETMSFSRNGLISQLEYEEFTHEQAVYGVDNISVNWNEQAVKKAQSYLKIMSFSRDGLISQLEYEEFTHEQAIYAVNQCGL